MEQIYDSRASYPGAQGAPASVGMNAAVFAGSTYVPPQPASTRLNPNYGADETVPGLECSYGTFAYSYSRAIDDNVSLHSHCHGCHNPVETAGERHHCDTCGGDYCSIHAEPAAHDCGNIMPPA